MNNDMEFRITLRDLKTLSNAVCDLDSYKPRHDVRINERVSAAHAAIIRTLGEQVGLIYAPDDEEQVPA